MSAIPPWLTPAVLGSLAIPIWANRIRPRLAQIGEDAAVAFLMFDRRLPTIIPGPQFNPTDMEHLFGLFPFGDDEGMPFVYNPAVHVQRIDVAEQKIVMFGLIGRERDYLELFVDGYFERARSLMSRHGPIMDSVGVTWILARAPAS